MKGLFSVLLVLSISIFSLAQAPQAISYQAVLRDGAGNVLVNQSANLRFAILQGSLTGNAVYIETHSITTSSYGGFSLSIGSGNVVSGSFVNIDWANGPFFLKTELDTGGAYVVVGNTQLLSVPYALYAGAVAGGTFHPCVDTLTTAEIIFISDSVYLSNGNSRNIIELTMSLPFWETLTSKEIIFKTYINGQLVEIAGPSFSALSPYVVALTLYFYPTALPSGQQIVTDIYFDAYPCKKIYRHITTVP